MAKETLHPAYGESSTNAVRPELLMSAVLHLMSHYSTARTGEEGTSKLASVIERHLQALAELPDLAPVLRATCRQLSEQWADMVAKAIPSSDRQSFFHRLIAGSRVE